MSVILQGCSAVSQSAGRGAGKTVYSSGTNGLTVVTTPSSAVKTIIITGLKRLQIILQLKWNMISKNL